MHSCFNLGPDSRLGQPLLQGSRIVRRRENAGLDEIRCAVCYGKWQGSRYADRRYRPVCLIHHHGRRRIRQLDLGGCCRSLGSGGWGRRNQSLRRFVGWRRGPGTLPHLLYCNQSGNGESDQRCGDEQTVPGAPFRVCGGRGAGRRGQVLLPSIFFPDTSGSYHPLRGAPQRPVRRFLARSRGNPFLSPEGHAILMNCRNKPNLVESFEWLLNVRFRSSNPMQWPRT